MSWPPPLTAWRIVGLPNRPGLDVRLSVETTAPAVVEAIEKAAAASGVELERVESSEP
jgi:hypothetical protein